MPSVLLVDDEFGLAEMAAELLTMAGYTVTTAINGKLALASLNQMRPDVILLDVMMPIMSGPEMLRVLKADAEYRDIPVVMISAVGRDSIEPELFPLIVGFLQKPFTYAELMAAVSKALLPTTTTGTGSGGG